MRKGMVIGRAISFTFGFIAGTTEKWWLLWASLAGYLIIGWIFRGVGKVYDIPYERTR